MKHLFLALSVVTIGLIFAQPIFAHGNEDHRKPEAAHDHDNAFSPTEAFNDLQNGYAELVSLLDVRNLEGMHDVTENMSTTIQSLIHYYPDEARLVRALKQLSKVVKTLHAKSDSGDVRGTAKTLKRVKGGLELIKVNLPKAADKKHNHGALSIKPSIIKAALLAKSQKTRLRIKLARSNKKFILYNKKFILSNRLKITHKKCSRSLITVSQRAHQRKARGRIY